MPWQDFHVASRNHTDLTGMNHLHKSKRPCAHGVNPHGVGQNAVPQGRTLEPMDMIKIAGEYETEVFVNADGGVAIRQKQGESRPWVAFSSKDRVLQLIKALREVLKEADFKPEEEEE